MAADKAIAILQAKGVAGEVAIADLQGPVEDRVTGLANREQKTLHRVGQTWLWASVTKQVAATLVLQQVGQGKMALDAPISAYLKDFSGNRTLTLKDLLQHRTDLPDPWESPLNSQGVPAFHLSAVTGKTDRMAAKGFCAGPGKANPNREFRYNNCDYLVLGAALEAVTGQDFQTLVKRRLNQGLGLKSVSLAKPGEPKVKGYDGAKPYPRIYASTFGASAAMQGSAADMVRFDQALFGGGPAQGPGKDPGRDRRTGHRLYGPRGLGFPG
jgi:CubicO group peptidase (beta-lactamase class C family)